MKFVVLFFLLCSGASFAANLKICDSRKKLCRSVILDKTTKVDTALEEFIKKQLLAEKVSNVELEFISEFDLGITNTDCDLVVQLPKKVLKERLNIKRKEVCKDKTQRNSVIWAKAKYFVELKVAATIIPKFDAINRSNTERKIVELDKISRVNTSLESCDRVASLVINPGDVISYENSMCKQTVLKGEEITVLYEQGMVFYKLGAEALASGEKGDVINVKFKHNGQVKLAKIVDKGIATYD